MTDWGDRALACTREQFAGAYLHPFLYAELAPLTPVRPQRTEQLDITKVVPLESVDTGDDGSIVILPVVKVQSSFPSMITVGRTLNNDVVIPSSKVSKFHAWFQIKERGFELTDAGSRNGTRVRGELLEPKGRAVVVRVGDTVSFGALEFTFIDAAGLWNSLVNALDQWG